MFSVLNDLGGWQILITCTNIKSLSDFQQSDKRIGDTFRITYEIIGVGFSAIFTCTEYVSPKRMTFRFEGGMSGSMSFTLEAHGDSTKVTLDVEYEVPGDILEKSGNSLLVDRMFEKDAERLLENFQILAETRLSDS